MKLNLRKYYSGNMRVLVHILFWLSYWLYHSLLYSSYYGDFIMQFATEGLYLPVKMAATYCTLYILLPRYFFDRKYLKFVLIFGGLLIFAATFQRVVDYTIVSRILNPDLASKPFFSAAPILKIILGIYPVVALAAFIKLAKHWYERDLVTQELEKDKLEAELKFLKAQIHPHFLFNTLNNLYALTLKGSKQAAEVVLKLSGLLSYMLYEGNRQKVALQKELDIIETYNSLEKIRYGNRLKVSYKVSGDIENKEIPPMIIIPFIENTFKHGTSGQPENAWINIQIDVDNDLLTLMVVNSKTAEAPLEDAEPEYKVGIGLKNVKRRLDLLYGERYELQINDEPDTFKVILKLQLDCSLKPEET